MNQAIYKPREIKKKNQPVFKTLNIPIDQRSKFLGIGSMNLKRISSKTGIKI